MAVKFDFIRRLGAGHFGEVWLATDTGLNVERAVKLVSPSKVLDPSNFFHEAQILKAVEHSNIVRVEETGQMADGRLYVAMEYLPRGSLEDEARGGYLELTRVKCVFVDILRGLEYAHSQGILHRDIKPGNILVGNNREGKLSDFGLAMPAELDLKAFGVKDYVYFMHLAPEVHLRQQYSVASDIYACGVTLYRLVNGDRYLPSLSPPEICDLAVQGKFPDRSKYREFVPRPIRVIANKAMHVDPSKRYPSAEAMRHALEQVATEKNWHEKTLSDGKQWTCGWNDRCYEVTRRRSAKNKWVVTVKKGRSRKTLRRITELCAEGLSKAEAERHSRRVLQDFVLGKMS